MQRILDLFPLATENLERDGFLTPVTMILDNESRAYFVTAEIGSPESRTEWAVQVVEALRQSRGSSYYVIAESWIGTTESGLPASEQPNRTEAIIIHGRHESGLSITAGLPFRKEDGAFRWGEIRVLEKPEAGVGVFSDLFDVLRRAGDPSLS